MDKKSKLKQNKKRLSRLSKESISMKSFLSRIIGIKDNKILSRDITHDDLKVLFPEIQRKSYDDILEDPQSVLNGEVYLVEDSLGHIVPYKNPIILDLGTDGEFYGEYEPDPEIIEIPDINDIELTMLSIYELQKLLELYSRLNIRSAQRKVRRELISRKESHHASRESVERALRKSKKNERFEY